MFVLTFVLPVAFIIFCYVRILNSISEASVEHYEPLSGQSSNANIGRITTQARVSGFKSQRVQRTVVKILISITGIFFVCYLPYHMERLFVHYYKKGCEQSSICHLLYPLAGLLQVLQLLAISFRLHRQFSTFLQL